MKTITLIIESGFEFKFNNTEELVKEMLWNESVYEDTFNDIWYNSEEDKAEIEKALEKAHFTKRPYCWEDSKENAYFLTTI